MTTLAGIYILISMLAFAYFWDGCLGSLFGLLFKIGIIGIAAVAVVTILSFGVLVLVVKACVFLIELL